MLSIEITFTKGYIKISRVSLKSILEQILNDHGYSEGFLNIVVIGDNLMTQLHGSYLNDSTPTDVMSFEFDIDPEKKLLEGEVYANMEQVARQAKEYKTSIEEELLRVIVHGTLHLVGYDDKTDEQRKMMREKEDYYLKKY